MRIIAQKNNDLNSYDFFQNGLTREYIDGLSFYATYTKDNEIVIFNDPSEQAATTNTINQTLLKDLNGYEIALLDTTLMELNKSAIKKDLYINITPPNITIIDDENLKFVTERLQDYVKKVKTIIEQYPELKIHIHSISSNIVSILKREITDRDIGFAVTGSDFNFIDVDYYILISNTQNDLIIDMLHKQGKDVILYVYSEYYISYIYEHYFGEKSTPYLQETFQKLGILTNYPEIIHKIFQT